MCIDIFLGVSIPIFTSDHVLVLDSGLSERQLLRFRLKDLVIRVLDVDILFLEDCFDALVVLEIKALFDKRFEIVNDFFTFVTISAFSDKALSSVYNNGFVLQVLSNLLS